jgi:hypothetical protein
MLVVVSPPQMTARKTLSSVYQRMNLFYKLTGNLTRGKELEGSISSLSSSTEEVEEGDPGGEISSSLNTVLDLLNCLLADTEPILSLPLLTYSGGWQSS